MQLRPEICNLRNLVRNHHTFSKNAQLFVQHRSVFKKFKSLNASALDPERCLRGGEYEWNRYYCMLCCHCSCSFDCYFNRGTVFGLLLLGPEQGQRWWQSEKFRMFFQPHPSNFLHTGIEGSVNARGSQRTCLLIYVKRTISNLWITLLF